MDFCKHTKIGEKKKEDRLKYRVAAQLKIGLRPTLSVISNKKQMKLNLAANRDNPNIRLDLHFLLFEESEERLSSSESGRHGWA